MFFSGRASVLKKRTCGSDKQKREKKRGIPSRCALMLKNGGEGWSRLREEGRGLAHIGEGG